ncbi:Exonuclease III [Pelagirhabdus alkalitolerans]|uniref:Exonuclease III n=1 Tax=Pelagirhabdus alkalitolerans TaxID=1612202 RepID=A0A1G6IRQ4_9BACI|nr:endonuclease/exonuclease/phosphatase family protein [Pelagirhabdus alkalitolerans]SDC08705.1 Exonuclease III [Pelagirhabdus alkalitolerans]
MKIVSWNCNGKFREKYKNIKRLNADIYVIQECENPELIGDKGYIEFGSNCLWVGNNKNKGLGIFASKEILLENNHWETHYLRNFISAKVNRSFDLLAVWAGKPYIEEYCVYQSINFKNYNNEMVIIGDFNSNKIWDHEHAGRNHSMVVNKLKEINLYSAYHNVENEEQGEETLNTFYMYRHRDKGYHIDYAFLNAEKIKDFLILDKEEWLNYSDHLPIVLGTY